MRDSHSKALPPAHAQTILDSIADGVFTVDEKMRITYFNRAAEKITGVSRREAIGQYCFEVLRANVCERTCSLRCSFETGEQTINRHVNILRADGKQIPISISTAVLRDDNGNIVGGVETFRDLSTLEELQKEIKRAYTFEDIVSKNHRILKIFDILPNIAESESTVLIQGPSGSGKELFARAIHNLSPRKEGPFVAVNCGALPDTLLESELFGYIKGAFTDAKKDKPGRFALAKGGTIFLDEVESLPPAMQVKLLRVLQEREFEPLGATVPIKAEVRVIAATKDDLAALVEQGDFRDDLYFRLNVVKLQLPALAERRDDIPLLINHFIDKFNRKMGRNLARVSDEVLGVLLQYAFPGNVRELENIIEHAFVMCRGEEIQLQHLPPEFSLAKSAVHAPAPAPQPLQDAERQTILTALQKHNWNKVETAKALGLHRTTLWRKMKEYRLA
ncbi:MAG: Anaerobic nitric oxide reductase transcription regulator NorR [bacterium]|nr:Anaerobic nitric oxide reductase transcription regulator NorR [bacterium]